MTGKKNVFVIIGSASSHSANEKLVHNFARLTKDDCNLTVFAGLKMLPHFDPERSVSNPPKEITDFRKNIEVADGIVICTPEYVFSIPGGLKNALEWCVATTVFSGKPTGLITASAYGQKGHESLQLIMKTLMAAFTTETTLLVQGVKGKLDSQGEIIDGSTKDALQKFAVAFNALLATGSNAGQQAETENKTT